MAERIEVLAQLRIPRDRSHLVAGAKHVGSFHPWRNPIVFHQKLWSKLHNSDHAEPLGSIQHSFLANPCKINLVYYILHYTKHFIKFCELINHVSWTASSKETSDEIRLIPGTRQQKRIASDEIVRPSKASQDRQLLATRPSFSWKLESTQSAGCANLDLRKQHDIGICNRRKSPTNLVRISYESRTNLVRISYESRTNLVRISYESRTNLVRISYESRTNVTHQFWVNLVQILHEFCLNLAHKLKVTAVLVWDCLASRSWVSPTSKRHVD